MQKIAGINPWLSIWNRPRKTIQALISVRPDYGVFLLAAIFIIKNILLHSDLWSLKPNALTVGILASPVVGFIWLYTTSYLFYYTGKIFKGQGSLKHLKTVVAWSKLPAIVALPFALLMQFDSIAYAEPIHWISRLFVFVFFLWSLLIFIQGLREVRSFRFSMQLPIFCWFGLYTLFYFVLSY